MTEQQKDTVTERHQIVSTLNKLKPGSVVDFQFDVLGKQRLKCKLIGFNEASYFIFAIPDFAKTGYQDMLKQGNVCVLRVIIEGDLGQCIAFKASIDVILKSPHFIMFVSYPSTIESYSLRNKQRLATYIPASISSHPSDDKVSEGSYETCHGIILDISPNGCRMSVSNVHEQNLSLKKVIVTINFPARPDAPMTVESEIKSINKHDKENIALGIQFTKKEELIDLLSRLEANN